MRSGENPVLIDKCATAKIKWTFGAAITESDLARPIRNDSSPPPDNLITVLLLEITRSGAIGMGKAY
jgi:hypothetical protein